MTYLPAHIGKAMTAIAAALAFTSTPLMAQDATPPVDTVETPAETPAADPLAPEADTTPVVTDTAAPPAPKPKVETTRAKTSAKTVTTKATRAASAARPAARRASAAPAAAAPVAAAATAAPAAQPAPPPMAAEPAPAPVAEPTPASEPADNFMTELMENGALPIAAGALGLLAIGGTALAMRRRKRRREEEDFLARQQALDAIGDEPGELELDRRAEVAPAPAFTQRPAPVHDPIPERAPALARQDDADFMFRRVHKAPTEPAEPN